MIWDRMKRRARVLTKKHEVERELDEELRTHVEMEAEDLVRGGMAPEAARREALRRFGGVERTKERVRDERGGRLIEDFLSDLRYGARSLRRSPGFTLSALVVLALGIGATVSLYAAVDAVLLEPLPYPDSDRLVRVWPAAPARGVERASMSYPDVLDWRERSRSLDGLAAYSSLAGDYVFLGPDGPIELATTWVAGDFFEVLAVPTLLGRPITQEDAEEAHHAAVISYGLWQRLFGGDPAVIGDTFTLDYRSFEVVGVMPEGFAFAAGEATEVWVPLTVIPEGDIPISLRPVRFLQAFGRLAPGVTYAAAQQELEAIASSLAETYPEANAGVTAATVAPLRDWLVGDVRQALWVALGSVGLILLLACSNVANLLLARSTARMREVAVRMSLGAPSERIVRQLLTESALLATIGGLLGVALAWLATRTLSGTADSLLPRGGEIGLDASVLGIALLVTVLVPALAGLLPAVRGAQVAPAGELRGGRGGGREGIRLRRALVGAEVTLAVLVLIGAGLLGRSLLELARVDPGFETENRIAMTLTIADMKHPERSAWMGIYHEILDRIEAHPEVVSAGAIRYLPFRGDGEALPVRVEGLYEPSPEEQRYARMFQVSEGLFDALGVRLLRGRVVTRADGPDDPLVVVVNEAFQRAFFAGEDPVGRRFSVGGGDGAPQAEIIGVVADVRHGGLAEEADPAAYVRNDQVPRIQMSYVVHAGSDPLALVGVLRGIVREVDPDQAITEIVPLADLAEAELARPRFFTTLLGIFAVLALTLAAVGVYGVLAYLVRSGMRETGLRLALGASAGRVAAEVVGQGMRPVLAGLALGLAIATLLSGFVRSLLYGVEPLDLATFGLVAGVLAFVAVLACLVPAWFATRVDPMVSIRGE